MGHKQTAYSPLAEQPGIASIRSSMDPFDGIFESYTRHFAVHGARPDRETRAPWAFARLWDEQGWRPEPGHTILVTGSKGKGTVTRHIAWNLQALGSVGLVLSPEELTHRDRLRIDNQPIDAATFERLWRDIARHQPRMNEAMDDTATGGRYLSPTGWFLSVGLAWFHERGVRWVVVEGGRGVRHDEIGQLDATLAVVTSVHGEHLKAIGPGLADVWDDKLSIARRARRLVLGQQVSAQAKALGRSLPRHAQVSRMPSTLGDGCVPAWLALDRQIAADAFATLAPGRPFHWFGSPSFTESRLGVRPTWIEPVVHADSLDEAFLRRLAREGISVVLGLPSDKDVARILARLRDAGLRDLAAFSLTSPVGHVESGWLAGHPDVVSLGPLDVVFPDVASARERLQAHAASRRGLYIIGVQVFTRTMRAVFGIHLGGPAPCPPNN